MTSTTTINAIETPIMPEVENDAGMGGISVAQGNELKKLTLIIIIICVN